jgi:hypothetical protein
MRYVMAALVAVGFFNAMTTRACINVAIVAMVNLTRFPPSSAEDNSSAVDVCPADGESNSTVGVDAVSGGCAVACA